MPSNQIVPTAGAAPAAPAVLNQSGDNGIQIAHVNTVNVIANGSLPYPPVPAAYTALSNEYYQLIVTPDFDPNSRKVSVDPKRALNESMGTPNATQLQKLDAAAIAMLKTYPALIMNENEQYGQAGQDQFAYFAQVTKIRNGTRGLRIVFEPRCQIPQQRLNEMLEELDLFGNDTFNELNRTHWCVKNVNLVEELALAGINVLAPAFTGGQP